MATHARSKGTTKQASSLLIVSSKSGSMTPAIEARLRKAFEGSVIVEFDPKMELEKLVAPRGTIVVAGGDGTVGWVVRRLVDTKHPLGILSLGTFNNFAKSLHLPTTVDAAIRVIKSGTPHPITLGKLNGKIFLEAAAIGLFGETIAAGESAKDRAFGAFA
jgi:diacylglycerol kinase family enzyme